MSDLAEQIDALLALNAKGAVSHPIPGLAVELLERARDTLSALPPVDGLEVVDGIETFASWWKREGRFIDPDTSDVPWFDKRESLAESAYNDALSQASSVIAGLTAERAREISRREHTQQWYAERLRKIEDVAKREGLWDEVAAIIANGSGTRQLADGSFVYDPPNYAQQLNSAKHRAEAAEARISSLEEENKRLEAELKKQMHRATNAEYMGWAYRSMLGEKGLQVAKAWDKKGVKRVHHSWGPDAAAMTGEERAQTLLDWEEEMKTAVPVETVDGGAND